jgi:hypothetical protein
MSIFQACNCCAPCTIATDDFNRANDTNISTGSSCGWTEVSGDWSIDTNALTPDNPNEIVICNTSAAAGTISVRATCTVIGNADGDELYFILKYLNTSNYWYAKATVGASGLLEIYSVTGGGAPVQRATTSLAMTAGVSYAWAFCYSEIGVWTKLNTTELLNNHTIMGTTPLSTQQQAGFGVGALTSLPTFDNFVYSYGHNTDHPTCAVCAPASCRWCDAASQPSGFKITISGLVNDGCASCASLNGIYYTDELYTSCPGAPFGNCYYRHHIGTVCTYDLWIGVNVTVQGGHNIAFVSFDQGTQCGQVVGPFCLPEWDKTPLDNLCLAYDMTLTTNNNNTGACEDSFGVRFGDRLCDGSTSTCTIEAI